MSARSMLADEAAFLAAEQNLAELRRQINAAAETVSSVEEEKALVGPLEKRMWEFYRVILLSPPVSIKSACIKLRLLADPGIGIETGAGTEDGEAVRQVLAFLETQTDVIGFGEPEGRS
jgi:hypothetical protein